MTQPEKKSEVREALFSLSPWVFRVFLFSVVTNILVLTPSGYMLEVYDRVVNSRNHQTLLMLTLLVVGLYIMLEALEWVRSGIMHQASLAFDQRMRRRAFDTAFAARLKNMPLGTAAQVTGDLRTIRDAISSNVILSIVDAPLAMLVLIILFLMHPMLGWFSVIGAFIQFIIGFFNERRIREPLMNATRGSTTSQIYAGSVLRNAQVIRSMGMLGNLRQRWLKKQREFLASQADASDTAGANAAFSKLVQSLLSSSLLGIGCWLTLEGNLGGSGMIVGSILGGKVLSPLVQIIGNWRQVEGAREAIVRLDGILRIFPAEEKRMSLPAPKGMLSVEGIVAGAPGSQIQILKGLSFRVAPGDSLAVVGPSASGKTTLARLLTGVWAPMAGKVRLDGSEPVVWEGGCKTIWLNDSDETTAMVLLALAETKPTAKATAAAADALLRAHGCFGFAHPRAHGPAVAALVACFGQGAQQATDLEIAVVVNGKETGAVKGIATLGQHWLPVPGALLRADKNVVEFKMKGRGRYTYAATLIGFSPDVTPSPPQISPCMEIVQQLHAPLEYRGRPISAGSTSPVNNLENGQRLRVVVRTERGWPGDGHRHVLEISLPGGTRLDESSLSYDQNLVSGREITDSTITLFFSRWLPPVSFEVTGYAPGKFRSLPPVLREIGNPGFMSVGPVTELTVLAAGETSPDAYQMNNGERYALGKCFFDDGDHAAALEHLAELNRRDPRHAESEQAQMLLWIYTSPRFYDARRIVDLFEVLRERYPQLEIPFEKILVVGKAYADIGEFERSWLVCRAAIAASFNNDSAISAVLEDEGRFLGSIDFQERVWREYPDTAEVVSSTFALSQLLYQRAPRAHELSKEDGVQPERIAMLRRTADMLFAFLAMYPKDPLADDAGFSLANCVLALKNYPLVVSLSREFAMKHADSPLAPGFHYMTALGLFWQNSYAEALAAAKIVADGDSKDRDFARYIIGQICHAENKPKEAIDWYAKVKTLYPDAIEAIAYFEKKSIALDEVSVVRPGQPVEVTLKHRNIKEAALQVYRVDLMKLCLQQKNLSAITSVQLAGIGPELEQTMQLGDGCDYVEKERKISLPLKDEAAYLVICRGDDLFASGMILITPLKIEVQEDVASGRVRANVLDTARGGYRPEVHVKAIGSADKEFRGGETDLRGLFIADDLHGKATVIAREGESRYAFFRGETWLGTPANAPAPPAQQPASFFRNQVDFQGNLDVQNGLIQESNRGRFDKQRRQAPAKGVQMKQAF